MPGKFVVLNPKALAVIPQPLWPQRLPLQVCRRKFSRAVSYSTDFYSFNSTETDCKGSEYSAAFSRFFGNQTAQKSGNTAETSLQIAVYIKHTKKVGIISE